MKEKYKSDFEGVDEGSAKTAINNFIGSLNEVDYSPCNPMSTNAKYDSTFNTGFDYLKNIDIQSMIDICNNCIAQIIEKITTYKSKYKTYEAAYEEYRTTYEKYERDLRNYQDNKEKGTAPTPPPTGTLTTMEAELTQLANDIKTATF